MVNFARKLIVLVVGGTVVAGGIALLVLPGPAFVVIPIGLAILATEFIWAKRLLARMRSQVNAGVAMVTRGAVKEKSAKVETPPTKAG